MTNVSFYVRIKQCWRQQHKQKLQWQGFCMLVGLLLKRNSHNCPWVSLPASCTCAPHWAATHGPTEQIHPALRTASCWLFSYLVSAAMLSWLSTKTWKEFNLLSSSASANLPPPSACMAKSPWESCYQNMNGLQKDSHTWIQILTPLFTSSVTLGKLPRLCEHQSPCL